MNINYSFAYLDAGKKNLYSIPNPSFNKDLRETATRKHLYNLPASEMMPNLMKVYTYDISNDSLSNLDRALYFGDFKSRDQEAKNEEKCVASLYIKRYRDSDNRIYTSDTNLELVNLMQEFSSQSDVYFGWTNYYVLSLMDLAYYVEILNKKANPVKKTFEEMMVEDVRFKKLVENYENIKYYNSWLWWLPLGLSARTSLESEAKKEVANFLRLEDEHYDKFINCFLRYKSEINGFYDDLKRNLNDLNSNSGENGNISNISIILKCLK